MRRAIIASSAVIAALTLPGAALACRQSAVATNFDAGSASTTLTALIVLFVRQADPLRVSDEAMS